MDEKCFLHAMYRDIHVCIVFLGYKEAFQRECVCVLLLAWEKRKNAVCVGETQRDAAYLHCGIEDMA